MNKQDTLIVALLFAALLGWMFHQQRTNARQLAERRAQAALAQPAQPGSGLPAGDASPAPVQPAWDGHAATGTTTTAAAIEAAAPEAASVEAPASDTPATEVILRSAELELVVSSRGGSIVSASLPEFPAVAGRDRDPVRLRFAPRPALVLEGLAGLGAAADFELEAAPDGRSVRVRRTTAAGLHFERTIELRPRCEVAVSDRLLNPGDRPVTLPTNFVAMGTMYRGTSKNDTLGADALPVGLKTKPDHWESRLPGLFTGRRAGGFGCPGSSGPPAAALPLTRTAEVADPQAWLALKSRFFAVVYTGSATNAGFRLSVDRDTAKPTLALERISASVAYAGQVLDPGMALERNTTLYIGPKRLSYLWAQGLRHHEIMQFGWLKWVCMVLVPTLNAFYRLIPNYGVAVILLTVLVRVLFWPLTHKSTESMKRMQALQPQLKAIQQEFKESPQKVQQETWRVYRENKVNPMSSCLPTLVQIPVFIALYTVLRSAVELRFASFLWIADLSEPENLLAGLLPSPIHSLNILPLFMAATMVWQSSLTPTMGDPAQQKMMMWMMPAMMLFMFYPMPSGLVLYWTVSQLLSIAQLLWQRRRHPPAGGLAAAAGVDAAGATQAMTRQMRRRAER